MCHTVRKSLTTSLYMTVPSFAALALLGLQKRVPVGYLTRDPAETMEAHTYLGLVSNVGIVAWSVAAGVAFFTVALKGDRARSSRWFMAYLGLASALFLADDLLMLHERVGPNRLHIPQVVFPFLYAAFVLGGLWLFRHQVRRTPCTLLVLSAAWMVLSVLGDTAGDINAAWKSHLLEDGAKLLGILHWTAYVFLAARDDAWAGRVEEEGLRL